ncbi:hypothetical protein L4C38_15175 [Vibrio kasasachensis]|uniref:hypothetical protein n=1 Tax=Vibrio kasasachensis TaxID=2910248 RepID=UPI003D1072FF
MKKVAIAAAILAVTGSSVVNANVTGASTTLTKNITQECNIGLWAVGNDGSVGGDVSSELGSDYVHSELNDLKVSGQYITGRAKCNASGGYDVHVTATNGELDNKDSSIAQTVDYTLEKVSSNNFTIDPAFNSPLDLAADSPVLVGSGVNTLLAEFRLKMKLKAGEDFTYAGQYTETLTFDLTPL